MIRALPGYLQEGVQSVVIDAEAVAFDRDAGKILPFQILSTRGRKNIDEEDIKVRVAIYAFDCLFLNGVNLLQEPLTKRREALYSAFKEVPGEFFFVTAKISRDVDELQVFLEDSIAENTEGLIVKTMDATYEPSKRSLNWLKLKKDYMEGCGDSLDLVPIGAFHGRGKRTGVYGAYLLACYDEETEDLQSICKIGTGFSDEDLNALSESLRGTVIDAPKSYFKYGDFKPDVWFDPSQVWEVKAADLSVSPRTRRRRGSWTRTRASRCVSRDFCGGARIRRWRWRRRLSRWRTFTMRRRSSRTTSSTTRMGSRERRRAGRVRLRVHKSWSRECRVARRVAFERGDSLPSSASSTRFTRYSRSGDSGYFVVRFRRCRRPGFRQWSARGVGVSRATFESTLARLSMTSGEGGDAARVAAARGVAEGVHRAMRGRGPGPVARSSNVAGSSSTANASAAGDAAARVAEAARAREPLLDMKQRTTHDDPEGFMGTFFKASRLHYIGTWKHRYEEFLEGIPAPPPLAPPPPGRERLILHVDMDCFFASVAALGRPELASLPVAVSWSSSGGGELSSCNYPARARGCRAGMRIASAKRLCPNLVVMPYEFDRYSAIAIDVYRILHDVSPHVMGVSVDEACVDATADIRDPSAVAADVRARILAETGCVASVGSGPNRLIARLATKRAKPDGAYHVAQRDAAGFLAGLSAEDLPGVGRGAMEEVASRGLGRRGRGNADVRRRGRGAAESVATRALGPKSGAQLRDAARGVDDRAWEARPPRKSVGAQVTWGVRFQEASEAVAFVEKLAGEVSDRARRLRVRGRTLTLKLLRAVANAPERLMKGSVGHGVCDHLTRSATLSGATDAARTIAREATRLLADLDVPADQIRGVGVQISRLDSDPAAAARGPRPRFEPRPRVNDRNFASARTGTRAGSKTGTRAETRGGMRGMARSGMRAGTEAGTRVGKDARMGRRPVPGTADVSTTPRRWAHAPGRSRQRSFAAARAERPRPPSAERPRPPSAERLRPPSALADHPRPRRTGGVRRGISRVKRLGRREKARTTTAATVAGAAFAEAASAEATLRATYEDAARAARVFRRCRRSFAISSRRRAYLVDAAANVSRRRAREASALFAFARDLTRAQTRLPPFVTAVVGERGTTRARTFADAWLDACGRAEEDVTRVALTQ